ncbi:MFS transporter [Acinetobacter seifertii]|uniref:MFS transporter n=1 Tax=Acinetobacter seifertii TaxID=1530123 RepID=UPI00168BE783|nr:MFS transporter [Acinetobacter seifertii]QNW91571.1 MFS transporter [Acinetobacter seifertii]
MDKVFYLLKNNKWFLFLSISFLLSGIGSSLTQVLVFGQLIELKASNSEIAFNFFFVTISNIIALHFGTKLAYRYRSFNIFIACELLSLIGLLIPFYAIEKNSILFFNITTLVPSICSGLIFVSYTSLVKDNFSDEDFEPISIIESIIFSAVTLIGTGLGLIIYRILPPLEFIYFDGLLSIIVLIIFVCIKNLHPIQKIEYNLEEISNYSILKLNGIKLQTFILPLILYSATAPAMALMPTLGKLFPDLNFTFGLTISAGIALIFSRGIGQVLGPIVLGKIGITKNLKNEKTIIYILLIFIIFYSFIFLIKNIYIILCLIIFAHILSNIVFSISLYMMYSNFSENEISYFSTKSYQIGNFILLISSLLSIVLVKYVTPYTAYITISIASMLALFFVNNLNKFK